MALKKREHKPDNIRNRWRFLQNSTLNLQLYKNIHQRKRLSILHLFNKINEERKFEEMKNSTIKHRITFRNSLKGKIQYQENIKSSLTTHQHHKCQNVFIERRSNITTMFFKQSSNNTTWSTCQQLKSDNNDRSNVH